MQHDKGNDDVKHVAELIDGIKVSMLTTMAGGTGLRSRPMYTQDIPFDGTLWFLTSANSAVVSEIQSEPEVHLSYGHPGKQTYVSVNGRATVSSDPGRIAELWKPAYKVWFPRGKDDPTIRILRIDVSRAEFWDSDSAPVRAFQFARALVTGEQMKGGEHETVRLSQH
jgi:general stress protein 26